MEKAKILVTGATGNVGTPLTKQLLEMGIPFRIFVRDIKKAEHLDPKIERIHGDLNDLESLKKAVEGVESVFLITATTQQDLHVIEAAQKAGCRKIVKLSTQEAGWTPIKGHGHWHRERELLIEESGLAWTFLRPTMMMPTALYWKYTILQQGAVVFPGGMGKVPVIHPADIASVAIAALTRREHGGRGYELTGSELLTLEDMTTILSKTLNKPLQYIEQSDEDFIDEMVKLHLPKYVAEGLAETFRYVRTGDFAHATDFVQQITGRAPITFESWCRENKEAFRD